MKESYAFIPGKPCGSASRSKDNTIAYDGPCEELDLVRVVIFGGSSQDSNNKLLLDCHNTVDEKQDTGSKDTGSTCKD